ncbi:hypothetical protein [Amycolatopsis tucumanensis]|uniref:Uncharacterized protein n=1 Tax=Amycolatopsis tucumanensis TaxID=401106 RepID=A0ABP7JQ08_9PSEU|nr:hypothetical protein [Amycolatopsis tucumanensis]MCF6428356.1 hypothetical protein [Amycolatopsis tucumanensis]
MPEAEILSPGELRALGAWMDRQGLPGGPVEDLAPIAGGTQNLMVSFPPWRPGVCVAQRAPAPAGAQQ